ncbi:hypothetical protein A2U01_0077619, partial [Trifolium medium]|nr:hypothetical protein [Trifolium medium]
MLKDVRIKMKIDKYVKAEITQKLNDEIQKKEVEVQKLEDEVRSKEDEVSEKEAKFRNQKAAAFRRLRA